MDEPLIELDAVVQVNLLTMLKEHADSDLRRVLSDSKHDFDGNSLTARVGSGESIGDLVPPVAAHARILDLSLSASNTSLNASTLFDSHSDQPLKFIKATFQSIRCYGKWGSVHLHIGAHELGLHSISCLCNVLFRIPHVNQQ